MIYIKIWVCILFGGDLGCHLGLVTNFVSVRAFSEMHNNTFLNFHITIWNETSYHISLTKTCMELACKHYCSDHLFTDILSQLGHSVSCTYPPPPPLFFEGGGGGGGVSLFFRFCVPYSCLSNVSLEVDLRYCKKCTRYDGGWISYFLRV